LMVAAPRLPPNTNKTGFLPENSRNSNPALASPEASDCLTGVPVTFTLS
jgi:hypothetical protein